MAGYLIDKDKGKCYGCEACVQICPKSALKMEEDDEGFRYPILNKDLCVKCSLCHQVCLYENMPVRYGKDKYVFGGYIKDEEVRFESTSQHHKLKEKMERNLFAGSFHCVKI